ncbi:GIY-YIG nuclease family protein [Methylobacterium sp. Leaf108]|uniref:GIY-YIG nuclease family protein n=1 Tax=Methylobacterium sp. Leaf108 TaxID=1736256 RepID=UPI0006F988E7|nr:GIY-YIG nuclease family protein [Methylobacterium sp. Leaf108]KQP61037.1 hypothetical protein ASF39_15285 [Methylobacterium sp. Leaf108]
MDDPWLKPWQVKDLLGLNQKQMDRLIGEGMPCTDLGQRTGKKRLLRFRRSIVLAWYRRYTHLIAGTIYVVGFGSYVKIGFTRGLVARRIRAIEHGAPEPLRVYATFAGNILDEGNLIERFKAHSTRGEWFRLEGAIKDWVQALPACDDLPSPSISGGHRA